AAASSLRQFAAHLHAPPCAGRLRRRRRVGPAGAESDGEVAERGRSAGMSEQKPEVDGDKGRGKSVWTIPAVRDYALVCLAALLMVALIMLQDPIGLIALLPVLVGIISLAIFWAAGPVLVLLTLTILCLLRRQFFVTMMPGFQQPTEGFDLILGLVLAIYCIGHYRLQSLVRNASPYDYRRDRRISTRRAKRRGAPPA